MIAWVESLACSAPRPLSMVSTAPSPSHRTRGSRTRALGRCPRARHARRPHECQHCLCIRDAPCGRAFCSVSVDAGHAWVADTVLSQLLFPEGENLKEGVKTLNTFLSKNSRVLYKSLGDAVRASWGRGRT